MLRKISTIVIFCGLTLLCGCAGKALHHSFGDYSTRYAEAMNEQLLLNLARVSLGEPPYFIQLGQMNAQFTYKLASGFSPSHVHNDPSGPLDKVGGLAKSVMTLGGSLTAEATEQPNFNFVPLNGEQFAAAINNPISEKLVLTLYAQGFHADLLARTLFASVRLSNGKYLVNHPKDPSYYDFLQFCDELRGWQDRHELIVTNVPSLRSTTFKSVKLSEVVPAIAAGLSVTNGATDGYVLTAKGESFRFAFVGNNKNAGFAQFIQDVNSPSGFGSVFQMRTFFSTIYAVAREEAYFAERQAAVPASKGLSTFEAPAAGAITMNRAPKVRSPILTMTNLYSPGNSPVSELVSINHRGTTYRIADEATHSDQQNHRVFSLLALLFADIAIDPQKLPVQQLIQVH